MMLVQTALARRCWVAVLRFTTVEKLIASDESAAAHALDGE